MRFPVQFFGRNLLRLNVMALLCAGIVGLSTTSALAQGFIGFTWGGAGSTTATSNYNLATNWSTPPAGAPPVAAGQGAYFDAGGASALNVTGPIAPNFFSFGPNAQSYTLTGGDIDFSSAAVVFGATPGRPSPLRL